MYFPKQCQDGAWRHLVIGSTAGIGALCSAGRLVNELCRPGRPAQPLMAFGRFSGALARPTVAA
ncbi:hypothetical protein ATK36_0746 [Amycolatopsis sulphurea]|uniref:Uncharacterized protein n=1 Tax=Amycolatopsis sulphurea TaxID=76022 RepID=A0A2A9G2V0_9PSEU|nr:hypothetical protein ATK36_0746 [Amycolatopsis sulphurea]